MEDYPDFHGDHPLHHVIKIQESCKCGNNTVCKCENKIIVSANFPDNAILTCVFDDYSCK